MAFQYLMYLASVGMNPSPLKAGGGKFTNPTDIVLGTAYIYQSLGAGFYFVTAIDLTISYYSISHSLVVLLTRMIVIRLAVRVRNVRKATGASDGSNGLHTAAASRPDGY